MVWRAERLSGAVHAPPRRRVYLAASASRAAPGSGLQVRPSVGDPPGHRLLLRVLDPHHLDRSSRPSGTLTRSGVSASTLLAAVLRRDAGSRPRASLVCRSRASPCGASGQHGQHGQQSCPCQHGGRSPPVRALRYVVSRSAQRPGRLRGNVSAGPAVGRTEGRTTQGRAAAGTPRAPFPVPRPHEPREATGVERSRAGGSAGAGRAAPTGDRRARPSCGTARGRRGAAPADARVAGRADAARAPASGPGPTGWRAPTSRCGRAGPRRSSCASSTSDGTETRCPLTELTHEIWHGFVPGRPARAAVRLPGARPLGPVDGRPLEPGEAAAGPVRPCGRRRLHACRPRSTGTSATGRSSMSPTPCATTGTRRRTSPRASSSTMTTTGRTTAAPRRPWADSVIYELHVRGFTKLPPGHPAGAARHLRRARAPGRDRAPDAARGDGGRAAAGAPVRPRGPSAAARAAQLLGLQLHRLLRPARRLRGLRHGRAAGRRVQADGARPARAPGSRSSSTSSTTTPPRPASWARRSRCAASTTAATTASSTTPAATPTTPAAATPCTSSSRRCCG